MQRRLRESVVWTILVACVAMCGAAEDESRWVHPLCQPLDVTTNGPFVELADKSLMTFDSHGMRTARMKAEPGPQRSLSVRASPAGRRAGKSPPRSTSCARKAARWWLST